MILLVSDLRELRASPTAPATGTVLESRVDKGRGPVATVLVQGGTLRTGDVFICGAVYGKVRAMFDDKGRIVKEAGPSTPVEVLGLQGVPEAGDPLQVTDEAKARHIVDYRQTKIRDAALAKTSGARITLDQLHEQLRVGEVKELPVVIKADVQGSVEVLERNAAEAIDRSGEAQDHSRERRRGFRDRRAAGFGVKRNRRSRSTCGRSARRRIWRSRKTWTFARIR